MKVQTIPAANPVTGTQADAVAESSSNFSSYLQTTVTLEQIFDEAAQTYGVSKNLLKAIAKAESDFNPTATSRSGAQGVMQLMPATAAELGVSDSYDPYQNIMGGSKYISQLLDKYDGNVTLALAAYNAGSNNVAKYGGVPPFKETQNYVVKVAGFMKEEFNVSNISCASTNSGPTSISDTDPAAGTSPATVPMEEYYQSILDDIFSYEDYLEFLELYMKLQELQNSQDKKEEEESRENGSYYSYQGIKYNPTVLNLLGGTEGI